ncbi:MAG: helix-turn-helix domain-containing protein, partial [Stellaceae bacterium]
MLSQILVARERMLELPARMAQVVMAIRGHTDRTGWCWLAQATLAGELGCSRQTANKWLRVAAERGVDVAIRRTHGVLDEG